MKKLLTIVFVLFAFTSFGQIYKFLTKGGIYKSMRVYDSIAVANAINSKADTTLYTGDSYLRGDRIVYLDGHSLIVKGDPAISQPLLQLDYANGISELRTFNNTNDGNRGNITTISGSSSAQSTLGSSFNDGITSSFMSSYSDAFGSENNYTADAHTFNGSMILNTVPVSGDTITNKPVTIDASGNINQGFWAGGGSANIYNADGTLTGNRTVDVGSNTFGIQDGVGQYIHISPADGEMVLSSPTGTKRIWLSEDQGRIVYESNTSHDFTGTMLFNTVAAGTASDSILTWNSTSKAVRMRSQLDTATMLAGYKAQINKNTDSISAHNIRIGTNTANIAANTSSLATKWSLTGNTILSRVNNYIGSSDTSQVRIRTKNIDALVVDSNQNIGIGVNNSITYKLAVGGNLSVGNYIYTNTANTNSYLGFLTSGSAAQVLKAGQLYLGSSFGTAPTSLLHLSAGTTAFAPFGFTSGALLTTPLAGKMEFLTDAYYGTITTGAARKTFAFLESPSFTTPSLGVATATSITATTFTGALVGNASSATNMAGGSGGTISYQTAANTSTMLANGTAGQVLQSNGTTLAPTWVTLAGGGNALTSNPLSQFAATTSAQLAGVISDEVGTDKLVYNTSPTLVTPTLGVASLTSGSVTGTAGAGFLEIANQSSTPSTPTLAGRIYFDNTNRLSWKGTNGFTRTFDGTANTANRTYTLPDSSGTVALIVDSPQHVYAGTDTWTGTTAPSGTSNKTYSWTKVGKMVSLRINIWYTVAGAALTQLSLPLPADCPAPQVPTGYVTNDYFGVGYGGLKTSHAGVFAASRVGIQNTATTNTIKIFATSGAYIDGDIVVTYWVQ